MRENKSGCLFSQHNVQCNPWAVGHIHTFRRSVLPHLVKFGCWEVAEKSSVFANKTTGCVYHFTPNGAIAPRISWSLSHLDLCRLCVPNLARITWGLPELLPKDCFFWPRSDYYSDDDGDDDDSAVFVYVCANMYFVRLLTFARY